MKRTFLTAAICLLAACTDGGQQPGAPLNASRNGEAAFEATEGTTVRLEEYLHVTGGVPPYGYATSLQGDFAPSLERTVPAPEHSPAEYGVYVCDSRGNRTESPVVVSLKILPADRERTPAFPGAEGGGRYVTGGRGGRVYYVTNLLDAYPVPPEGSLRWALTQPGPKIVMFKVSGVIPLAAKLHIRNDGRYAGQGCDITVAGETAPGDGIHLPEPLLRLIWKVKGPDRIVGITDAMRGAGMPDGPTILGSLDDGMAAIIEDGVAKLPDRSSFAGSVCTTDRVVRNYMIKAGASLPEAVQVMTLSPARLMHIDDRKGSIAPGKDADIVLFDAGIDISLTMIGGKVVFRK